MLDRLGLFLNLILFLRLLVLYSPSGLKVKRLQYQEKCCKTTNKSLFKMKMKPFIDNLASAGHPVTDDDQVLHLLSRLGLEYDPCDATHCSS